MPTIEIIKKDLEKLLGKKLALEELAEKAMPFAKAEVETAEGDKLKIGIKDTNRPDLLSVEGIARELRGFYGIELGLPRFKVRKSDVKVSVDPKLKNIRPKGAYAIAKGIKVTEHLLEQMIQLQEKICETFGRKRKEIAIGLFDYDKVNGNLHYYAADTDTKFVPLDFNEKLSLKEILKVHPKGMEYGHLLEGHSKYPLLVDSEQEVLSMPPIINSEYSGKVTPKTTNIFIDVTGFNQELINIALDIVCAALHDRGASIKSVTVEYKGEKIITPILGSHKIEVPLALIENIFGEKVNADSMKKFAEMKRMNCKIKQQSIEAEYPSYRADILHAVDIVEDLLIAADYNKLRPEHVHIATKGSELEERLLVNVAREACIGLGLQEVLTFTLSSKERQQKNMLLPEMEFVELENPISSEYCIFRRSLLPELLAVLSKNKHRAYPQHIFEAGKIVLLKKSPDGKAYVDEKQVLAIALADQKANFNEIKAYFDALCNAMGWHYKMERAEHVSFEKGLCASIKLDEKRGIIGEISKKVLENFGLSMPVAVLEIEL